MGPDPAAAALLDRLREELPRRAPLHTRERQQHRILEAPRRNQTNGVAQAPAGAFLLRKLLEEENVPVG